MIKMIFNKKLSKTDFSKILSWIVWLIFVIFWNFFFPKAKPIEDVIVSVILSIFVIFLNRFIYHILKSRFEIEKHN